MIRTMAAVIGISFAVSACAVVDLGNNDVRPATSDYLSSGPVAPAHESILFSITGASLNKYFSERASRTLDKRDNTSFAIAADKSLRTGEPIKWKNTATGNRGRVEPGPTYQATTGRTCRSFIHVFWRDSEKRRSNGTACRLENGSWEVIG